MSKPRRPRSDSITAALKAMTNAGMPDIEPPPHCTLRDGDRPFWAGIMQARARDQWTPVDLVVAAQLARCQADIERGDSENVEELVRREMALMRTLRLGGAAAGRAR